MKNDGTTDPRDLRWARHERGLSLQELAEASGYSGASSVSRIELGMDRPSPKRQIAMAKALGISRSRLRALLRESARGLRKRQRSDTTGARGLKREVAAV